MARRTGERARHFYHQHNPRREHKWLEAVLAIVRPEFTSRAWALAEAEDDLSFSKEMVSLSRRSPSDAQRRILKERESAVERARAQAWPKNTYQHLSRMVDAVGLELASGNRCPTCIGAGIVNDMGCKDCRCAGIEPRPDRRRALAMGCDPSDYPKRWKGVFEWLLGELHQSSERAAKHLSRALSNRDWSEEPRAA